MFEAYGMTAGPGGISLLDGLLNKKGLLGKRESTEMRAAAALGLGHIADPQARAALERAAQDAARRWRFKPARQNGRAVSAWVTLTFSFDLER